MASIAELEKVLRYPKDAAFVVPGGANKKMVWVPFDSDFGYVIAEVVEDQGNKKKVKLESGEVSNFGLFLTTN
jgi:hypothetical protein